MRKQIDLTTRFHSTAPMKRREKKINLMEGLVYGGAVGIIGGILLAGAIHCGEINKGKYSQILPKNTSGCLINTLTNNKYSRR